MELCDDVLHINLVQPSRAIQPPGDLIQIVSVSRQQPVELFDLAHIQRSDRALCGHPADIVLPVAGADLHHLFFDHRQFVRTKAELDFNGSCVTQCSGICERITSVLLICVAESNKMILDYYERGGNAMPRAKKIIYA